MRSPFADWLTSYTHDTQRLNAETARVIRHAARQLPNGARARYLDDIGASRWGAAAAQGHRDVKLSVSGLTALRSAQHAYAPTVRALRNVTTAARLTPTPSAEPEFRRKARQLRSTWRTEGRTSDEIASLVKTLEQIDPKASGAQIVNSVRGWESATDEVATRYLALQMAGTFAVAVARFNRMVRQPLVSLRSAPDAYVARAEADLDRTERAMYAALRTGDAFLVWGWAVRLRRECARRLLAGAIPHAARLAVARKRAPDDPTLGATAIQIAELVRRDLFGIAFGLQVEWAAGWGADGTQFQRLVEAASGTAFGSGYRWPRAAAISSLARRPAAADGTERTVSGRVGTVSIAHRRRKAISVATLTDGSAEVNLALPHIKLDSGGITPGSWLRVAGTWRAASSEAAGEPALEIDRRAIAHLGRTSWTERVLHETSPLFVPVPHGLAAAWSWQPGVDGAANPLRYGVWSTGKDA